MQQPSPRSARRGEQTAPESVPAVTPPAPEMPASACPAIAPWFQQHRTAQPGDPLPVRGPLAFARDLPLRDAVAAAFAAEIDHALAISRFAATRPSRAVHEFRKSVRRARALVRLLRPLLPDATRVAVERTLAEVARSTSALRDIDVLPAAMQALDAAERRQFATLQADLWARRDALRRSGEAEPVLQAGAEMLVALTPVLAAALRPDLTWDDLGEGLHDGYRRTRKALQQARKHPNQLLIHDWRKRAKDLRHQMEFLLPDDAREVAGYPELVALVKDLGDMTDLIALRRWSREQAGLADQAGTRALARVVKARIATQFGDVAQRAKKLFHPKAKHFAVEVLSAAEQVEAAEADATDD